MTLDLTDDEKAALVAHLRPALDMTLPVRAPARPLKAILEAGTAGAAARTAATTADQGWYDAAP
jgi:hypothetical protein